MRTRRLKVPFPPMEATPVDEIPIGDEWQYEPKWDGFRCIAFRRDKKVELQSKSGKPLTRYFPEVVEQLLKLKSKDFVIDGEIVIASWQSTFVQRFVDADSSGREPD